MRDEILYERKKLPVWAVVKRSYGYVWRLRGLLAVPLALLVAAEIACALTSLGLAAATARLPLLASAAITTVPPVLCSVVVMSFAVGLHRAVLLDEIRAGAAFLHWDRYFWNAVQAGLFILMIGLVLAAIFTAALVLPLGIGNFLALFMLHPLAVYAVILIVGPAPLYIAARLGLAFPAAALGYRGVFTLAWRVSADNGLRLMATLLLACLPLLLFIASLTALGGASGNLLFTLGLLLIDSLVGAATISVIAVVLSLNFFFLFQASDLFGAA